VKDAGLGLAHAFGGPPRISAVAISGNEWGVNARAPDLLGRASKEKH